MKVNRYNTPEELAKSGAEIITAAAEEAINARGLFSIVIPGGRSPVPLFKELAAKKSGQPFPWDRTHIFWGDERCLPRQDPDSNFRLAREFLIKPAGIGEKNIHPIPVHLPPEKGAEAYRRAIKKFFSDRNLPIRFDCVILGMGADGHTASILVEEIRTAETREVFAAAGKTGSPPVPRISLGYPLLLSAGKIILIAAGRKKEKTLRLASSPEGRNLPVERIIRHPETIVMLTPQDTHAQEIQPGEKEQNQLDLRFLFK